MLGGILTGLMSVGGGLILIFMLMLIPPLFGYPYTMHEISGMLIIYTFCSTVSGLISYYRNGLFDRLIAGYMGFGSFAGGAIGAWLSVLFDNRQLTLAFALLSLVAVISMLLKPEPVDIPPNHNKPMSLGFGLGIGVLGGMFGLGAGFLFVPVLLKVFKLQPKQAVGTGLAIAAALVLGAFTVQARGTSFPWMEGLALSIGGITGAQIGSAFGRSMNVIHLRRLMVVAITIVAVKIWIDVLSS
jgi:uncharacterized membrane protein YfcA